jgi:response regulator RpfG family c-di-GMP phosphodiesterase
MVNTNNGLVILIDDNKIKNFINKKFLEQIGIVNIRTFTNTTDVLSYLKKTLIIPELILIDNCILPENGLGFINGLKTIKFSNKTINIFVFSKFINPDDIELAIQKSNRCVERPLTIEKMQPILE